MELGVATLETDLEGALLLGPQALALAEGGQATLLSAYVEAEALVLGALQLETTLRERSPARFDQRIARRTTTGTEAQCSGPTLFHALALPRVDTLFSDASARTLLNRNLRAFLRGYTAAGVPLRYFGTEVLALLGHPVALVGYDVSASGAVLIEVMVGLEHPCVVRPALKREPPAALYPLLRRAPPAAEFLRSAVSGFAARLEATCVDVTGQLSSGARSTVTEPTGVPVSVAIPLGVVEAVPRPVPRIFGDLLVSRAALARVEAAARAALEAGHRPGSDVLAPLLGAPLDGARPADILAALDLLPD
ncbi:MAG TPA: hypothetical protein VEX18_06055 [Polyangiaceae bacterium]|nr:hypothetical protein [Polyangiaceae bacterium]